MKNRAEARVLHREYAANATRARTAGSSAAGRICIDRRNPESSDAAPLNGLRRQLFITIILLAIEIVLGIMVNLFVKLPAGDKGTPWPTGFGAAITSGPVSLAIHAIVGTLIVLANTSRRCRRLGR